MTTMPGADSPRHPIRQISGNTQPPNRTTAAGQPISQGGRAIYLPAELASYLRAAAPAGGWRPSTTQIHGWIQRSLLAPAFRAASVDEIVVDFEDLVTGQAIALLRAAGISLDRIERAEGFFSDLYGIDRPFAHRCFWTAGRDVFGKLGDGWIAGTRGGQLALPFDEEQPHPIETHLIFDPKTGRPVSWYPTGKIELRPTIQSGQPCISGTSILTASVKRYARGADTLSLIARKLGLDQSDVEAALDWEHARAYRRGPDTPWPRGRVS
jgi:uncharacterized protein (DUF433 family)